MKTTKPEPLSESYFYILLCLSKGANHGYGIMKMTETLSEGEVKIGSGTMYGATSNMIKKGWIKEIVSDDPGAEKKRTFRPLYGFIFPDSPPVSRNRKLSADGRSHHIPWYISRGRECGPPSAG